MLCDEQAQFGGSLLSDVASRIDGEAGPAWAAAAIAALRSNPRVTLLPRTTAFGFFPHNFLGLCERLTDHLESPPAGAPRERLWQVRAGRVILATGAIERPLVFPGNDRPGIMLAGAAQTYLNRYGVKVGGRVVIVTAHDAAYQAALDLRAAGVTVAAVADLRSAPAGALYEAVRAAGIDVIGSSTVLGTAGDLRVRRIDLGLADGTVRAGLSIPCDAVLMSGGFTPTVHLFSQSRGRLEWSAEAQAFVPGRSAENERSAGACRGVFGLAEALADGATAGAAGSGREPRRFAVEAAPGSMDAHLGRAARAYRRPPRASPSWIGSTT